MLRQPSTVIASSWRSSILAHICPKLSQTRYESGDGSIRMMCAVSATHKESGDVPYFWFALHRAQIEFLEAAQSPYVCFGCASAETTLLIPLPVVRIFSNLSA